MRRVSWCVAVLASSLAACGGGGGGDGAASTGGTTVSASGLLPAAPTVGAVLFSDASALRPIHDGAIWTYRGSHYDYTGASPVVYQTTTSQTAAAATSATESESNSSDEGAVATPLTVSPAAVTHVESADFTGKGAPGAVTFIELRSPVRQNDQYTILDQHYSDTSIDADGDKKPDALDVAIYARVVGIETLNLPNLPALTTVRVDTTALTRVTYSSNGTQSPVIQFMQSVWYAPGIGIVQVYTDRPTDSGNSRVTNQEQLVSWDGVTAGFGAMAPVAAIVPPANGVFPGQPLPVSSFQLHAFAFGDHALIFTNTPGIPTGTLASRVDLNGKVLGTTLLSGLTMGGGQALAYAGGVVYVDPVYSGSLPVTYLSLLDTSGALVGPARGVTIPLDGGHVTSVVNAASAAMDGSTFWLLYSRWYYDPGTMLQPANELVLRPFALDGTPLASETIVDNVDTAGFLKIESTDGKVLMTWTRNTPGYDVMYASASLDAGAVAVTTQTLASGLPSSNSFVEPVGLGANAALMWSQPPGLSYSVGTAGGILLDPALTPVRAGTTLLDEQIPGFLPFDSSNPGLSALGPRIVLTTTTTDKLLPQDVSTQPIDVVSWMDTGSSPLAQTATKSVRYPSGHASQQAVFPDRVLVFGGSTTLSTTVVWLNSGVATSPAN